MLCLLASLQWRHNGRDGVSNHQPHDCSLNCLFRRRSKKTSKFRVTGLCAENSPVTGEFPAHRAVTRKMFPFDDVIMMKGVDTSAWIAVLPWTEVLWINWIHYRPNRNDPVQRPLSLQYEVVANISANRAAAFNWILRCGLLCQRHFNIYTSINVIFRL